MKKFVKSSVGKTEKIKPEKSGKSLKEVFSIKNIKNNSFALACILPSLIGVIIFFIVPFIVVMFYSVVDNPINKEFVFLDNFVALFHNTAFKRAAYNTLIFSLTAVPLVVALGLGLAFLLDSKIPMLSQFRASFLLPMMVPVASIVRMWQVMFHYNGTVNEFLSHFNIDKIDWLKSQYAMIVILLLFLWKNLGYNMILFLASINSIPKDQIEVARIEGASSFYIFVFIKLRHLAPSVLFVSILSLINSFKVFREVYLLTGDYPFDSVYILQHFMNNTFRNLDYQKLSAAAIIMSAVIIVIIGTLFILENKLGKENEE